MVKNFKHKKLNRIEKDEKYFRRKKNFEIRTKTKFFLFFSSFTKSPTRWGLMVVVKILKIQEIENLAHASL